VGDKVAIWYEDWAASFWRWRLMGMRPCYAAYGGLTLLTNHVASQSEIDLIGSAVTQMLVLPMPTIAALPTSRSYLKIVDVPYFVGMNNPLTSPFIKEAMGKSHLASLFTLANSPQVM
jgi:hypothetical protein